MESIAEGVLPAESEVIDDVTHYNDIITTALRTKEGINIDELPDTQRQYILSAADRHIAGELLQLHGNMLSLTRKGLFNRRAHTIDSRFNIYGHNEQYHGNGSTCQPVKPLVA